MNRSLTTTELKKPYPSRLIGGVQMQNKLVPHGLAPRGVPEGKEKEQEIGNLFEKIVKENFLSWQRK